jgi:hypothetical protein
MLDYRSGIDVRPESPLKRLDMQATDGKLYSKVVEELTGRACGKLPNGTDLPCIANRHFTATPFPFQVGALECHHQEALLRLHQPT